MCTRKAVTTKCVAKRNIEYICCDKGKGKLYLASVAHSVTRLISREALD